MLDLNRIPYESVHIDEGAAIGFRRLSITDLEGGDQPIFNEDKSKLITFNGEIYNFRELREDLISKGHDSFFFSF